MVDFTGMVDVMESHQKTCGVLEFTSKAHKEIKCSKCGTRIYKGEENMMIESEDCHIEFL
jgi:PHP family Zn ribbon phosphoesterase